MKISHVGLGIVDKNGKIIFKKERDYEIHKKDMSKVVLNTIIELIDQAINKSKIDKFESIGIAVPGTVSNGIIIRAENLGIKNLNIEKELKEKFNIPVYLQNDAKCAAIAEKKFGSLKKYDDAIFLVIGTGIGGAVFLDGKLLRPKKYSAFEVGHMAIHKNGKVCGCGRKGCFETYGSIKRLKEKIKKEFNLQNADGKQIKEFMIKNKGNTKLENIIDTYIDDLSIGIANLINIFEPEIISIGGSFAYYKEILLGRLQNRIIQSGYLFNKEERPKLVIASLKNDAGIIGSAMI